MRLAVIYLSKKLEYLFFNEDSYVRNHARIDRDERVWEDMLSENTHVYVSTDRRTYTRTDRNTHERNKETYTLANTVSEL